MAYRFNNQYTAKAKIQDDTESEFTLTGINGATDNADSIMSGLTILLDIVGWGVQDAQRIVTQDIEEVDD